jgi:hypothetical protein
MFHSLNEKFDCEFQYVSLYIPTSAMDDNEKKIGNELERFARFTPDTIER